ncbi:MAG: hypothetical protein AAF750_00095 [Planctomycetota bacterium]
MQKRLTLCCFTLLSLSLVMPVGADDTSLPSDDEYVVARDGDLFIGDRQVRFWAGIGSFPPFPPKDGDPYRFNHRMIERLDAYGFNMMRLFGYQRRVREAGGQYTKGDGSRLDIMDHMIALAMENGVRIWVGGNNRNYVFTAEDVDIVDDPDTAAAWAAAVAEATEAAASLEGVKRLTREQKQMRSWLKLASVWDPRLEAVVIRNTQQFMDHVNQHTGLRVGDDPVFGVWELTNEQWWIVRMVSGQWQKAPEFFRQSLLRQWHDFLEEKYGSQAALERAWIGLLEGEDLEAGTILLAPMRGPVPAAVLNDANPLADAKFVGEPVEYGRDDFHHQRGADVNEFFAGLILSHKARVAEAFKQCGKSARLSPLLWDTGIGYNGISQLLHQHADAVSHCTYIGGWTHDTSHHRYPWYSGLEEWPRLSHGVPWLEHNTVEGKPYFIYETQIGSPSKFRAEYPYRVLFLAALQGWDAVCWHTMSGGYRWDRSDSDEALVGRLSQPGHAAAQFTYKHDETQLSAMRAAGEIFKGLYLDAAPTPTTFIYGRKTVFHPDSMSYGGSYGRMGDEMVNTSYRYGSRIKIDLDREDDEIVGPTVPLRGYALPNPLRPTDQMTYDWNRGYLTFDAPGTAAFVGFLPGYGKDEISFDQSVTFSDFEFVSSEGMTFPVTPEEGFVAVAVVSTDGQPLQDARSAIISAVSTSHNTGLEVGPHSKGFVRPKHTWQQLQVTNNGELPLQFTRIGCTITSPHLAGMRYTARNWLWQLVEQGVVESDGVLRIDAKRDVFLIELEREDPVADRGSDQ